MQHYRYCSDYDQSTDRFISELSDDEENKSSDSYVDQRKRESVGAAREKVNLVGDCIDTQ